MKIIRTFFSILVVLFITLTAVHVNAFALKKTDDLVWPADPNAEHYWIRSLDVYKDGRKHGSTGKGIDIYGNDTNGSGTVYAIAQGTIVESYNGCGHVSKKCSCGEKYGNYIKIKHDDDSYSLYAHLKQNSLTSVKTVRAGDPIAKIGSSGNSDGVHLHFEIFSKDDTKDYAFDYFMNNAKYHKKFLFVDGLQKKSKKYGDWISKNYTTVVKSSSGNRYWGYSGSIEKPFPPQGLDALQLSEKTARISWKAVSTATSYEVQYKSPTSSAWKTDKDYTSKTSTSYTTTNLGIKTYQFRVRAVNGSVKSDWTTITYVHKKLSISAPTGLAIKRASDTTAKVSWKAVSKATSYEVQYKSSSSGVWKTDKDYTNKTSTSYTTKKLGAKTYQFRVRAVNGSVKSDWTTITYVHKKSSVSVPIGLPLKRASDTTAKVSWKAVLKETSYEVQYKSPLLPILRL